MKANIWIALTIFLSFFLLSCGMDKGINDKIKLSKNINNRFDNDALDRYINTTNFSITNKKNIVIFIVDTLRPDHITPELAPTMSRFKSESLHAEYLISGATSSDHSFFSLFFSRPSYQRNPVMSSAYSHGAPTLRILKKAGYKLYVYASPRWVFKLDQKVDPTEKLKTPAQLQLLYGEKMALLDGYPRATDNYGAHFGEEDHTAVSMVINKIKDHSIDFSQKNNFVVAYLASAHYPYLWSKHMDTPLEEPYYDCLNTNYITDLAYPTDEKILKLRNSYKNAVKGVDFQFNRLVTALKEEGVYDDTIIALLSDHGEMLFENNDFVHGKISRTETSSALGYLKLTEKAASTTPLASQMDIFPTIFDHLGVKDYGAPFFFGESLLAHSNYGAVSVKPNLVAATYQMALYSAKNGEFYKVIIEFNSGRMFEDDFFVVRDIRNMQDESIQIAPTLKETNEKIKRDFKDLFYKMTNI